MFLNFANLQTNISKYLVAKKINKCLTISPGKVWTFTIGIKFPSGHRVTLTNRVRVILKNRKS